MRSQHKQDVTIVRCDLPPEQLFTIVKEHSTLGTRTYATHYVSPLNLLNTPLSLDLYMHTEIALQPLQPPIHYIRLQDDPPAAKESGQTRSAFIIKDNSSVVTLDLKFTLLTVTLSYSLNLYSVSNAAGANNK